MEGDLGGLFLTLLLSNLQQLKILCCFFFFYFQYFIFPHWKLFIWSDFVGIQCVGSFSFGLIVAGWVLGPRPRPSQHPLASSSS